MTRPARACGGWPARPNDARRNGEERHAAVDEDGHRETRGRAADLRHPLLVHDVLPDQGCLLLRRVPPACPLAHDSLLSPCFLAQGMAVTFRLRQNTACVF